MRADQCMCHLQFDGVSGGGFNDLINAITVRTIPPLSEAGAPSGEGLLNSSRYGRRSVLLHVTRSLKKTLNRLKR